MQGPLPRNRLPILSYARVIGYDTINHGVYVQLPSMQTLSETVKVLINGPADATRVEQMPLPVMGTWGLVAFPFGDLRSAIWLGSFYQSVTNAITSSKPTTTEDSQIKYTSHASGEWSILDYFGNNFTRYADGTIVAVNSDNKEPVTYQHKLDSNNTPVMIQVTEASRNPNPPSPFFVSLNHPSGSSATITPSGMVTITAGKSQLPSITMTPDGIVTIAANKGDGQTVGPIIILDTVAGNVFVKGQNGNSQIQMDSGGNVTVTGAGNMRLEAGGSIAIVSDGGDTVLDTNLFMDSVNRIISTYNLHTHQNVTPGQGNSGPPNQILT